MKVLCTLSQQKIRFGLFTSASSEGSLDSTLSDRSKDRVDGARLHGRRGSGHVRSGDFGRGVRRLSDWEGCAGTWAADQLLEANDLLETKSILVVTKSSPRCLRIG